MTEQTQSAEALELVSLLRKLNRSTPQSIINCFRLNLLDAGKALERFAERRVSAETERCARIADSYAHSAADSAQANTADSLISAAAQDDEDGRRFARERWRQGQHYFHGKRHCAVEIAKAIRAPAKRPAPPQQKDWRAPGDTTSLTLYPDGPPAQKDLPRRVETTSAIPSFPPAEEREAIRRIAEKAPDTRLSYTAKELDAFITACGTRPPSAVVDYTTGDCPCGYGWNCKETGCRRPPLRDPKAWSDADA